MAGPGEPLEAAPGHADEATRVARCAARLTALLLDRDAYRARWQPHMQRSSGGRVHQGAVVRVLAEYLWDAGLVADTDRDLPRRLKHTVSRALRGTVLTPETLGWFVDAFDMSPTDAATLWALRSGAHPLRLLVVRPRTVEQRQAGPPPRHESVALHEFHTLGPAGLPQEHRTVHVVRALEEMRSYTYRFDTDAAAVEVLRGGRAGALYRLPEAGLYAVDIEFTRPLEPGETASFEYRTVFSYRQAPPPVFRRGVLGRATNVELHVQFHPAKLPRKLWWAVWDDLRADSCVHEEPVRLEDDGSVHRYLDVVEAAIVGFRWKF